MKKRIGFFGPKIDFDKLDFDENGVYMTNITDSNGKSYSPIIFQDGTILCSKEWSPITWRQNSGIVRLVESGDYAFIYKDGKLGSMRFEDVDFTHPVFGTVLYAKGTGQIHTWNEDAFGNVSFGGIFKDENGYDMDLFRDKNEAQIGQYVTARRQSGLNWQYVLVSKDGVLPYRFNRISKNIGKRCAGFFADVSRTGVITLINGELRVFDYLDENRANDIANDYWEFLKLPLCEFADEKIVQGYMEIAKQNIRDQAHLLEKKEWPFFKQKTASFNEAVEKKIKESIEEMRQRQKEQEAKESEEKSLQDKIDGVGRGISKIYKDEEFRGAVDALNQGKKEMTH